MTCHINRTVFRMHLRTNELLLLLLLVLGLLLLLEELLFVSLFVVLLVLLVFVSLVGQLLLLLLVSTLELFKAVDFTDADDIGILVGILAQTLVFLYSNILRVFIRISLKNV